MGSNIYQIELQVNLCWIRMEYQRGYTSCSVKMNIDAYCTSIVHRFLFRGFSYMFSFFFFQILFWHPCHACRVVSPLGILVGHHLYSAGDFSGWAGGLSNIAGPKKRAPEPPMAGRIRIRESCPKPRKVHVTLTYHIM